MNLLRTAKRLVDAAERAAIIADLAITACVVDQHGNIILKSRMDGSTLISIEMAERKAYTAAALRMRTADIAPLAQPGEALFALLPVAGGRYTALGGGIPLSIDGEFIGGVGISGGTSKEDTQIAEAALGALEY